MVSPTQERALVGYLDTTRSPHRDRAMFLLSIKAGLRAKAMASLTWAMVTDAEGQLTETIHLENRASMGKTGGRTMPMHPDVHAALVTLQTWRGDAAGPDRPVLFSERGGEMAPATVRLWFHRLYTSLKMHGCSSHSGRRTFMTRAARTVSQVGGSLRDVQERAGHTSPGFPQHLVCSPKALMIGPQRLVTATASLLIDDRLLDALGVLRDRCAAVSDRLSAPGHGTPTPTQDRCSVANPHINRYTQHRSEPPRSKGVGPWCDSCEAHSLHTHHIVNHNACQKALS